ncbi:MAG TPA: hypothetical protein V6C95_05610 [Coleofasciculaceae cyanobacterium]
MALNSQRSNTAQYPGLFINGLAIAAFLISLYCCTTPALQILPSNDFFSLLIAPLQFTLFIHLGLMSWMSIWVIVIWSWILWAISSARVSNQRGHLIRWWLAPVLLGILLILWVSHIPLAINFAVHKPAFEKLADWVESQPSHLVDIEQKIGNFQVIGGYKLGDGTTPTRKVSLSIEGIGAYQGFIRDASRQANRFDRITYTLAPGSNNGDQDIYYFGDGWYVFQNYFD